ncbi:Uncharacterised protein [Achromobacter xylosoxidans]|nr:Uncharacterised protein [Achromobacter xylosoxidans]
MLQHQHRGLAFRNRLARLGRGQFGLAAFALGDTGIGDRAALAGRLAARTEGGAQVHQALRVGGHVQAGRGLDLGVGQGPQALLDLAPGGVAGDAEVTGEDALDVAVQDGRALAIGEGGDGGGGRAADAGQGGDGFGAGGEVAIPVARDLLGAAVQVAGAGVVAQAGPVGHHVFLGGGGQRGHVGKALQEAFVVGDHRGHLRLLQHDLGEPDAVGIPGVLPGEIVAAVLALPGDDARGEVHARNYRIALLPGVGRAVTTVGQRRIERPEFTSRRLPACASRGRGALAAAGVPRPSE